MPSKSYTVWLDEDTFIVVDFRGFQGRITSFIVRLVHIRGGVDTDVARYDTAHGWPHLDLVSPTGRLRRKRWMEESSFDRALTRAINDFRQNHEKYVVAQVGKRIPEV